VSRPTLASRTALVTTAVTVVTVLIAGALTFFLSVSVAESTARGALARLADRVAVQYAHNRQVRTVLLASQQIGLGVVNADGTVDSRGAQVRAALSAAQIRQVLAGQPVSDVRNAAGGTVLVEARPTRSGGIVLVQRRSDARALATPLIRRTLLALLVALAVAIPAGILLARRLARPLQRAAHGAHALAAGQRDVRVTPEGPAEVADVAESINRLAGALEYSEGRQRDFLLSVSHELRTPLTAIAGFAESLSDGVTTGAEVPAAGRTILAESRRLERLVRDLLDLARLGAADFRIDLAQVDLTSLLRDAAGVWRARCEAEGVPFSADLPGQPLIAGTDPTRIRQIVDGLAENALRVTPAGRPIVFGLYVEPAGGGPGGRPRGRPVGGPAGGGPGGRPGGGPAGAAGMAVLQVRDGGPGLTPQDCAVAFERSALYERYRGVRRVGTGLGLALVYGLATRLGGTAHAGRAPEGGACFTVRIPLAADISAPTVPSPPADRRPTAGDPGQARPPAGS
jgi:two-component system sensor histidine kinase BaeS